MYENKSRLLPTIEGVDIFYNPNDLNAQTLAMEVRNHIKKETGIEPGLREINPHFTAEYGTSPSCNLVVFIYTSSSIESSTVVLSKHVTRENVEKTKEELVKIISKYKPTK